MALQSEERELWYSQTRSRIADYESSEGPSVTRTFLDQEITYLQDLVKLANRRRNLLVVVARLLPELLLQIFRVVRDEEPPYQYRRMSYQAPPRFHLGWIRLTQVCQRWRQVALEHSSLWSTIELSSVPSPWVEEILLRSRNAPLSLYIDIDLDSKIPSGLERLLETMVEQNHARIKQLYVEEASDDTLPILTRKSMPQLEDLSIVMSESESEAHLLPEGLVTSGEPRLTKLTLSRCFFPYNSPAYGNLVHLDLRDLAPSCPPSFTQLNEMFASMNSLRTLKLADVFSHVIDPLQSRDYAPASFNLPQTLESLYWEEHVAVFLDITLYFIIAPTTTVEFAIPFDFQNTLSATKFSSAIATIVSRIWDGSPHHPETMQIRSIDKGGYTDSLVAVRHRKVQLTCACTDDWADVAPYDLMIKWHAVAPVKVTATTVCGVRADGLHDLALGIDDENMESLGPAVLPLAPNVRKLRIFESALLSALPRLRENICVVRESVGLKSPASPARLLLPHLESICIINDVGNLNAGDIGRVCEYLRMRKELGHGVEELHIPSRYSQNEEIMAQLREEVDHLRFQKYNV